MPSAPLPLRQDYDAVRLRLLASTTRGYDIRSRLLALAEIYDGASRSSAARDAGVTLQTLRTWVARFNAGGPDALHNNYLLSSTQHTVCRAPSRFNEAS